MRLTRRTLIKSGATLSALAGSPGIAAGERVLTVFDSRLPASRHFAGTQPGPRIDIASQDASLWRAFRSTLPQGRVEGLTSWSDLVFARGLLEEQGKRLTAERQERRLFRWTMV